MKKAFGPQSSSFSRSCPGAAAASLLGFGSLVGEEICLLSQTASKSLLRDPPVVECISASMWTVITVRVLLALDLNTALAQEGTAPSASQVEEIIVTAEKWEQAASTIGISITTATDDMLQERGCPTIGPSS